MLTLKTILNRIGGKSLAHIVHQELYDAFKFVDFFNGVVSQNVLVDNRMIDAFHNFVRF